MPVTAVGLETLGAITRHATLGASHRGVELLVVYGLVILRAEFLVTERARVLRRGHRVVVLHVLGQTLLALARNTTGGAIFLP